MRRLRTQLKQLELANEIGLSSEAHARSDKTLVVMLELTILLRGRSYSSDWEL